MDYIKIQKELWLWKYETRKNQDNIKEQLGEVPHQWK